MFSKTCEYAIRAMIFIAQRSKTGNRVGIKEIAKAIDAPEYFIAKILQDLSRKGLVQSLKGPTGGFFLEEESSECSLADIVTAIDGDKLFTGCGLGLKNCNEKRPCPIHSEFKKVREDIYNMLEDARIGEFSKQLEKNLTFLKR
ncbi:MAG TPA: Rrf2 family transcriptional regulator [Chitinophagaceae bacterium]|nr:Rrf2 family transcriptional regulator [Chitinophagaceae bacterium]